MSSSKKSSASSRIGLIGVGLLGQAIADRLQSCGTAVLAFDVDPNRLRLLNADAMAESAQQVFDDCQTVVLSLPTSAIAVQVVNNASTRSGQTVIDTTTGEPAEMVGIASKLATANTHYAEATVAGSSEQMRRGEASLFLGADEQTAARIAPLLTKLSSQLLHLGDVGAASRFKLVHNLILGLNRAALAEGLAFAEAIGFEPNHVLEILKSTPAASEVMTTKGPKMANRDFSTQARLSQHLKDVRLILRECERLNLAVLLSKAHEKLLVRCEDAGFGDADNSAVIMAYRDLSDNGCK